MDVVTMVTKPHKQTIEDLPLKDQRVLMRVDFNVPLNDRQDITDDTRIRAALPSIEYARQQGASVILMSHLGRPQGQVVDALRLRPVAARLGELLGTRVLMADDCIGTHAEQLAGQLRPGEVLLLENLRFHVGEEANDAEFARALARLGDVFVNDAFGTAHRAHASTVGVAQHLPAGAGYLLYKEAQVLGRLLDGAERPFVLLLGGAKVSDKIGVMQHLMGCIDTFLIGGAMAYTFLKAEGVEIGDSRVEEDKVDVAKAILESAHEADVSVVLPCDHRTVADVASGEEPDVVGLEIQPGRCGVDIGPKTVAEFTLYLEEAATVLWNGPMGIFETPAFAEGTEALAKMLGEHDGFTVIGGGDTVAAVNIFGVADQVSHVSTGGGASLEFLEGRELPGLAALPDQRVSE